MASRFASMRRRASIWDASSSLARSLGQSFRMLTSRTSRSPAGNNFDRSLITCFETYSGGSTSRFMSTMCSDSGKLPEHGNVSLVFAHGPARIAKQIGGGRGNVEVEGDGANREGAGRHTFRARELAVLSMYVGDLQRIRSSTPP